MSTSSQHPSSSSRDLTLVVESASGTPEEYFAQVNISLGRAKSNTIYIDHPDVDHIHAKVVKREETFWLHCEGQATLQVLDPEPGEVGEVELIPGLTIELGGVTIRCRRQMRGMSSLSDDYWADAAGGEQFRVESDSFTGNLPKKIGPYEIRKFVARGGMGIVLRGVHEETDLLAAVKLPTPDLNKDEEWLKGDFIKTVQQRGAEIIKARGASSAASAANAALDTITRVITPTGKGDWFSAAIPSDGSYGVTQGLIFSYPLRSSGNGDYEVVQGIELDEFSQQKIQATREELEMEREAVKEMLN